MKIGFFTDSYLPQLNGLTTSVVDSAKALERRGHEVFIIAPKYPRYKDTQKNVYRLTSVKFVDSPEMRWALEIPEKQLLDVLRLNFDIIHGHSGGSMSLIGLQIARVKGIPFVCTYHTLLTSYTHYFFKGKIVTPRMIKIATKFIANLCDCVIAPSSRAMDELVSCGVEKPIKVLPSGIDLNYYKDIGKGFIRNKIKISQEVKILLYVGRLGKEKSVDFLLKAFKLIYEANSQMAFVIIGDGPEKNNLKNQAKELGIEKNVYFLGSINHMDIPKAYADSDLFVFASQTETQGLAIVEALASRVPVVAVKDNTLTDVVINEENGYLVEKDSSIFAEKVIKILGNKQLYSKLSKGAGESVKGFSDEIVAKRLEDIYLDLIKEKGRNKKTIKITAKILTNHIKKLASQIKDIISD